MARLRAARHAAGADNSAVPLLHQILCRCLSGRHPAPPPADEAVPDQRLARSGGVGEEELWEANRVG